MTPRQIAEANGIRAKTFHERIYRGWDVERAATEPTHEPSLKTVIAKGNGVSKSTLRARIRRGWCWYRAATTPSRPYFYEWNPTC